MEATQGQAKGPHPLLVTKREAARMLGVSERTFWQLRHDGLIPTIHIGRKFIRFSVEDLREFIATHRRRRNGLPPVATESAGEAEGPRKFDTPLNAMLRKRQAELRRAYLLEHPEA